MATRNDAFELGLVPPQALDIENSIIGAILQNPAVQDSVITELQPHHFYLDENVKTFEAILSLYKKSIAVDMLSVGEELKKMKHGEYTSTLPAKMMDSMFGQDISNHIRIIQQKYWERQLILIAQQTRDMAFDNSIDVEQTLDNIYQGLANIEKESVSNNLGVDMEGLMTKMEERIKEREVNYVKGKPPGIPTGFKGLDNITAGWQPGDLIILAARPSMGKTALALHMAKTAAKNGRAPVVFSLETDDVAFGDRFILSETDVDPGNYKVGYFDGNDWTQMENAMIDLAKLPLVVYDTPGLTIEKIKSIARIRHKEGSCELIIIDYLQLINTPWKKNSTRDFDIGEITKSLKELARELNIPIVLLSQLNREVEKRASKRPQLSDLRESGSIEQDADLVIFLYRPHKYNQLDDEGNDMKNIGILIVDKHRAGALDDILFGHNDSMHKFGKVDEFRSPLDKTF